MEIIVNDDITIFKFENIEEQDKTIPKNLQETFCQKSSADGYFNCRRMSIEKDELIKFQNLIDSTIFPKIIGYKYTDFSLSDSTMHEYFDKEFLNQIFKEEVEELNVAINFIG
jgi:hypothetical protein